MKYAIIIALLATAALGQHIITSPTNIVDGAGSVTSTYPIYKHPASISDQTISNLITSGTVCRVRGKHEWTPIPHVTIEYRPDGNYPQHRRCDLCGKAETKTEEWK